MLSTVTHGNNNKKADKELEVRQRSKNEDRSNVGILSPKDLAIACVFGFA